MRRAWLFGAGLSGGVVAFGFLSIALPVERGIAHLDAGACARIAEGRSENERVALFERAQTPEIFGGRSTLSWLRAAATSAYATMRSPAVIDGCERVRRRGAIAE